MEKLGFSETAIQQIKNSEHYIKTFNESPEIQKTTLTILFYNILMYKPNPVPTEIRIGLNAANTALAWLDDMTTTVLPFLAVNADVFFDKA